MYFHDIATYFKITWTCNTNFPEIDACTCTIIVFLYDLMILLYFCQFIFIDGKINLKMRLSKIFH